MGWSLKKRFLYTQYGLAHWNNNVNLDVNFKKDSHNNIHKFKWKHRIVFYCIEFEYFFSHKSFIFRFYQLKSHVWFPFQSDESWWFNHHTSNDCFIIFASCMNRRMSLTVYSAQIFKHKTRIEKLTNWLVFMASEVNKLVLEIQMFG